MNRLFGESLRLRYIDRIFPPPVADEALPDGPGGEGAVPPLLGDNGRGAVLGVTVPHSAILQPPQRLYPICQQKKSVSLADLAKTP